MHIFCDESGGADDERGCFVVAAVALDPTGAGRLARSLRKVARSDGEVKGVLLKPEERRRAADLLAREPGLVAAAVVCVRAGALGGWALGALREHDLYGHLLAEAVSALWDASGVSGVPPVTADGGRYKRTTQDGVRARLAEALAARRPGPRPPEVTFADSAATGGLQVADVVANTVYRTLVPAGERCATCVGVVEDWRAAGRLVLRHVALPGIRPNWLVDAWGDEAR